MRKIRRLLAVMACAALLGALTARTADQAFAEAEVEIEEIIEEVNLDAAVYGGVAWNFPLTLEEMNPEFLILANNHYNLGKTFVCNPLVRVRHMTLNKDGSKKKGDMYLHDKDANHRLNETCANALIAMSDAARMEGMNLYLKSAYRSYGQQASIWERHLINGKPDGWAVKPGASDHQTGLGCDVVPKSWRSKSMNGRMASEPECIWMAEHCQEYGFVIRYPDGMKDLTEVNYEPWHLRYVGIPVATYIMENGLCLEEFVEQLQQAIEEYLAAGGDPAAVEAFIQKPTEE